MGRLARGQRPELLTRQGDLEAVTGIEPVCFALQANP